eukprot:g6084.t1
MFNELDWRHALSLEDSKSQDFLKVIDGAELSKVVQLEEPLPPLPPPKDSRSEEEHGKKTWGGTEEMVVRFSYASLGNEDLSLDELADLDGKVSMTSGNTRVGNLPYSSSWQDLKDHMRQAGEVLFCEILPEPGTALGSKGCGLVEFATPAAAHRAISDLTGTVPW